MSNARAPQRQPAPEHRRPAVVAVRAPAVARAPTLAPSAAQSLQRRLGNAAVQTLFARPAVAPSVQPRLQVSAPSDREEREAEAAAKAVARMSSPAPTVAPTPGASGAIARRGDGSPGEASPEVSSKIQSQLGAGNPLPGSVRAFMEPRFRADFGRVRIHTGETAAQLSRAVNAQAFTYGRDIFFGKGQYRPDTDDGRELLAHELAHTIQQRAAVQRLEAPPVVEARSAPMLQRFGVGSALNYFADKANLIPGFRMLTLLLGVNPINFSRVERNAANLLRAVIELLPGGGLITQALENSGVFEKAGAWAERQFAALGMAGASIKQAVTTFLDSLSWTDIADLGGVWERAKRIVTDPIERILNFASGLVSNIVQFIKDAILMPLAKLAEGTRGWDLLCAVLGKNPITGEAVPRTAQTLIPGFLKLIGQEDVWENMQKANAIGRAWTWFQGALGAVLGFVQQIPALAVAAFKSLEVADLLLVPRAFAKVATVFGNFVGNFINWAGQAVWNLLEIIFQAVSPGALVYIKKTGPALKSILKNPLPFVSNLVKAAKLGFTNFAGRVGGHLKNGLIAWLTGALTGVYIPTALSLGEIGKFTLSVLEIGYTQMRAKIVKKLGPTGETIMKSLETGFDVVTKLVTGGPTAVWDLIKENLSNLKDQVINGIIGFITDTIVHKAIPKLISLFIPGAGFISAILSIYDTIMVFVQKISQISQIVTAFINSIVAIANGNIAAAAHRVESIFANIIPLAVNFLVGFIGLGKIAEKIIKVLNKIHASVERAIDSAILFIVNKIKNTDKKQFALGKNKKQNQLVKENLVNNLVAEIGEGKSQAEAKIIVEQIAKKFKPHGVSAVKVGVSNAAGECPIIVEMSPGDEVARLSPGAAMKKSVAVKLNVELTLEKGGSIDEKSISGKIIATDKPVRKDKREYDYLQAVRPWAATRTKITNQPVGGIIFPESAGKIQLITWSTSKLDANQESNTTHAERQFVLWLENMDKTDAGKMVLNRVVGIELHLKNYSPCGMCIDMFSLINKLTPNAKIRKLSWYKLYTGVSPTTRQGIDKLNKGGWSLYAPSAELPTSMYSMPVGVINYLAKK